MTPFSPWRKAHPQGRQGRHVLRVVKPRRVALRRSRPLRRHPQPGASGLRRRRAALLPGHRAGATRAADPVRGDARPLSVDGTGGLVPVRGVAVLEPAEDAAGAAEERLLARAQRFEVAPQLLELVADAGSLLE